MMLSTLYENGEGRNGRSEGGEKNEYTWKVFTRSVQTFGNGAKNSSLVRTDKHGIQVKKDITATGIDGDGNDYTGSGNTVLHANGQAQHIHNYNTITVGKGFTKTVGMAATSTGTAGSVTDSTGGEKCAPSKSFPKAPKPKPAGTAAAKAVLFSCKT